MRPVAILTTLLTFVTTWTATAAPAARLRIPTRVESAVKRNIDVWISAGDLVDPGGKIKRERLDSLASFAIPDLLTKAPVDGCVSVEGAFSDFVNPPRRDTLQTATRNADFIVEGEVTDRAFGFLSATPGQLLRVDVTSVWAGASPKDFYYVFVPVGRFYVGSTLICKTDRRYPDPPLVGERIVLFGQRAFLAGNVLETLGEGGFVRVLGNGKLALPARYQSEGISEERQLHDLVDSRESRKEQ